MAGGVNECFPSPLRAFSQLFILCYNNNKKPNIILKDPRAKLMEFLAEECLIHQCQIKPPGICKMKVLALESWKGTRENPNSPGEKLNAQGKEGTY